MTHPKSRRILKHFSMLVAIIAVAVLALVAAARIHASAGSAGDEVVSAPRSAHGTGQFMRYSTGDESDSQINRCGTPIYYTSYPAKCRSVDGSLIRINAFPSDENATDEGK